MHACPVDAYEKDPVTGIVKHLDDQCFGCQYCTLACPYEAPKYSRTKGIVRKCDMCSDRLADGEAPACVQSCPNGAIAIRVVDVEQVVEASETNLFVPGAPEPGLTLPTTTYRTRRVLPRNMIPANYHAVRPADAHWSLILMLALGVSVLHLGRPQHAYRAVIGLRHSWLSREILAFGLFAAPDRATTPLRRDAAGVQRPLSWDAALRTMVARFKAIQAQHGPESVAFLSTGQTPTEEMALLGALAKFGMGMVHGDGNTRQCMATAVVAYKQAFGFDAPPYTYRDFEQSDVIVLVGANLCIAHPIMWERVLRNPHRPAIVVIDPRVTETAMQASQHLALRPKSDQALFYGLVHLLIERGWIDRGYIEAHTRGFEEYSAAVAPFTIQRTSADTGLPPADIERLAATIHSGQRVSFWWTMGVNQSYQGVRTAQSIINLALITGSIGRPGTGANSITGQCNAMGSRLFSNTTSLLGGRDFENPVHRETVARALGLDPAVVPGRNSWAYNRIIEGILREQIKGLWVVATNTAHSWINQSQARDILGRLDCLVVQDMYASTETARMADLVLPAAAWGEKDGTFINSERRIGTIRKVARTRLRRGQSRRREGARHRHQRHRPRRVAPRQDRRDRVRHPFRSAGPPVHTDALRSHQPAHRRGLRPLLQAAVIQGLCGRAALHRGGRLMSHADGS